MFSELKWNYFIRTRNREVNRNLYKTNEINVKTFICLLQDVHFRNKHFLVYGMEFQNGLIFFLSLIQRWVQKLHRIPTPPDSLSSKTSKAGISHVLITFKFQTKCDS